MNPSLPDGFELAVGAGGRTLTAIRHGAEDEILPLLERQPVRSGPAPGRGAVWVIPAPAGAGAGIVYKRYRRGGLLGRLLGGARLGWQGLFRELEVSQAALLRGLDVPRLLAVRATRRLPGVYSAEAFFREIPHARDLPVWFGAAAQAADTRARRELIRLVAAAVRRMHDAGLWHADLNAWNLLVQQSAPESPPRVYIVDLDKARRLRTVAAADRMLNLVRLYRSTQKIEPLCAALAWTDAPRFLKAYTGDAPWPRAQKRRLATACRRALAWHRLWWRLVGRGDDSQRGTRS